MYFNRRSLKDSQKFSINFVETGKYKLRRFKSNNTVLQFQQQQPHKCINFKFPVEDRSPYITAESRDLTRAKKIEFPDESDTERESRIPGVWANKIQTSIAPRCCTGHRILRAGLARSRRLLLWLLRAGEG